MAGTPKSSRRIVTPGRGSLGELPPAPPPSGSGLKMSFSNNESWSWLCGDWPPGPTKPLWPGGRMVSAWRTRADAGPASRSASARTKPISGRGFTRESNTTGPTPCEKATGRGSPARLTFLAAGEVRLCAVSSQPPQAKAGHQQQGTRQEHRETVGTREGQAALLRTRRLRLLCRGRSRGRGRIARGRRRPGRVLAEHLLVGWRLLTRRTAYLFTEDRLRRRGCLRALRVACGAGRRLRALRVTLRAARLGALRVALRAVRLGALRVALRAVRLRALRVALHTRRRHRRLHTAGVRRVGLADAVVAIALVAGVVVRAVRHLALRVLVVGVADAARARLASRLAAAVAVHRRRVRRLTVGVVRAAGVVRTSTRHAVVGATDAACTALA